MLDDVKYLRLPLALEKLSGSPMVQTPAAVVCHPAGGGRQWKYGANNEIIME